MPSPGATESQSVRLDRRRPALRGRGVSRRPRPDRRPEGLPPSRPPRRAAPAPASSPRGVTAARGQPPRGERPGRRRVERPVWRAGRPPEVSHTGSPDLTRLMTGSGSPPPSPRGRAGPSRTSARTTAPRASKVRRPDLVIRCTSTVLARQERGERRARGRRGSTPGSSTRHTDACSRSAREPGPASTASTRSSPSGSASSRAWRRSCRVAAAGEGDLQVLGLAGRAGGGGVRVRDLRVRGEPGRVRHRDAGPPQRPLQRPLEVAVAGEPQPAALGVAQPQPLDRGRRGRSVGGACHGSEPTGLRPRPTPPRPGCGAPGRRSR